MFVRCRFQRRIKAPGMFGANLAKPGLSGRRCRRIFSGGTSGFGNRLDPEILRAMSAMMETPSPLAQNTAKSMIPDNKNLSPCDNNQRASKSLLHPDRARIMIRPTQNGEPDRLSVGERTSVSGNCGYITSYSSSVASSTTSIAAGVGLGTLAPDQLERRRRSSTLTARYSLLDALDLEYALMRAAGRGSACPSSLSQSLQKLTFTQSLAFPALAQGLADKRSKTEKAPQIDSLDSGLNAFAKVATAFVLVLVSVLVFGVVYKFVRT